MALSITKSNPDAYYADQTIKKLNSRIQNLNKTLGVGNQSSQKIQYILEQFGFQHAGVTMQGLEDAIRTDAKGNIIGISRSRNVITNMANEPVFRKAVGKALEFAEGTTQARNRYLDYFEEWKGYRPKTKQDKDMAVMEVAQKLDNLNEHLDALLQYVYKRQDREELMELFSRAVDEWDEDGKRKSGGFMTSVTRLSAGINTLLNELEARGVDLTMLGKYGNKV